MEFRSDSVSKFSAIGNAGSETQGLFWLMDYRSKRRTAEKGLESGFFICL